jgi:hypothetical protein
VLNIWQEPGLSDAQWAYVRRYSLKGATTYKNMRSTFINLFVNGLIFGTAYLTMWHARQPTIIPPYWHNVGRFGIGLFAITLLVVSCSWIIIWSSVLILYRDDTPMTIVSKYRSVHVCVSKALPAFARHRLSTPLQVLSLANEVTLTGTTVADGYIVTPIALIASMILTYSLIASTREMILSMVLHLSDDQIDECTKMDQGTSS